MSAPPQDRPMTFGQKMMFLSNFLRIGVAGHDHASGVWLNYDIGPYWPPIGVKLVASSLVLAHAALWSVWLQSHPQGDPAYYNLGPLLALCYPTTALIVYRTIRGHMNKDIHTRFGGNPYLWWLLGGDKIAWHIRQAILLILAAFPTAGWSVPLAGYLATCGVCMLLQDAASRAAQRRLERAITDGQIQGRAMMG